MERGIPVRSVSRSIAILRVINRFGSLPLAEIARLVDLPYPTACRIMQTLIHEGLIECEPTRKRYRATALVQSLAIGFQDPNRLVHIARPYIAELTQKIAWPVSIGTRVGPSMIVRDSTHSETSLTFTNYNPGYTFPLLESATGHAYLAYASDDELASILKGIELIEGPSSMLAMFQSGKLIERIRQEGHAIFDRSLHTPTPGKTSSISVPLFQNEKLVATLTMTVFSSAMTMQEAVARHVGDLKQTAQRINHALHDIWAGEHPVTVGGALYDNGGDDAGQRVH